MFRGIPRQRLKRDVYTTVSVHLRLSNGRNVIKYLLNGFFTLLFRLKVLSVLRASIGRGKGHRTRGVLAMFLVRFFGFNFRLRYSYLLCFLCLPTTSFQWALLVFY